MAFKKGNKEGGRKRGSKNKVTQETRELFNILLQNNLKKLEKKFNELEEPDKFIKLTFELAQFCTPKLRSVELEAEVNTNQPTIRSFSIKDFYKVNDETNEINVSEALKKVSDSYNGI